MGPRVLVRAWNQFRTQENSVQGPRCGPRGNSLGLEEGQDPVGSVEGPECGLWNICRGLVKYRWQLGSVQGPYVGPHMPLGSEQMEDQPG